MKILLLGDASNYNVSLATGLRRLGHDVTIASNGGRWMGTKRDIDLMRGDNILKGALLYLKLSTVFARDLRGYDIVQLSSPGFVDLRPNLLRALTKRLRRNNGAMFLTALGTDAIVVKNLAGPAPALDFSEWQIGGKPTAWADSPASARAKWLRSPLMDYTRFFYDNIDGVVSALYEYHRIIEDEYPGLPMAYAGIPVDADVLPAPKLRPAVDADAPVRILYAVHKHREGEKGADIILPVLQQLDADLPDKVELWRPGNVPFADFPALLDSADIVSDQLYSYTPATTALMAMAMGTVPISGGEEAFYDFIAEPNLRPVINPDPRDLPAFYNQLRTLVENPARLRALSEQGPRFVARHNSADVVARRFNNFWLEQLG